MGDLGEEQEQRNDGMDRLMGFSDGVFAIAITLLVLNLELPPSTGSATVGVSQLLEIYPDIVSFVVSFLVIGNYWTGHHDIFGYVDRYDTKLLWLNIIFLMFIAFIPFSTSVLGDHPDSVPVIIYAGTITLTSIALAVLWRYAWASDLLDATVDSGKLRDVTYGILTPASIFAGSILIALVSAEWAMYSWLLLLFADSIRKWVIG
jgi:uncharacterized membrane protein